MAAGLPAASAPWQRTGTRNGLVEKSRKRPLISDDDVVSAEGGKFERNGQPAGAGADNEHIAARSRVTVEWDYAGRQFIADLPRRPWYLGAGRPGMATFLG